MSDLLCRENRFLLIYLRFFLYLSLALYLVVPAAHAQFNFTFDKVTGQSYFFDCPGGGGGGFACAFGATADDTRFIQGTNVMIDGESYLHQIVGEDGSGFAQEVFILNSKLGPQCPTVGCMTDGRPTQDPTGVAMKQVISEVSGDDNFYDEFLKDRLEYKARTQQIINAGALSTMFEIDARSKSLTVEPLPTDESVPMINQVTLTDPTIPVFEESPGPGLSFDMNLDSDESQSTGSNYFYNEVTELYEYVRF